MGLNKIISVLSTFKDLLLALSQLVKFFKYLFNDLFGFLTELINLHHLQSDELYNV